MTDAAPELELDLEILPLSELKRKGQPLRAALVRDLTAEDLLVKATAPAVGAAPVLRLRHVHHLAARLMATDLNDTEVSIATGLGNSRLSILRDDPTFQELVAFYTENESARIVDLRERLHAVGLAALEEIHERLLDDPEAMSTKTLLEIANSMFEQAQGGKGRGAREGLQLSSEDLAAIKQTVKGPSNVTICAEAEFIEVETGNSGDSGTPTGPDLGPFPGLPATAPSQGEEGGGPGL